MDRKFLKLVGFKSITIAIYVIAPARISKVSLIAKTNDSPIPNLTR